jgi:fatty-acyl-CoA synthase
METGAIVVPLNTRFAPPEVANLVQRAGARVIIASSDHAEHVAHAMSGVRHYIHVGGDGPPGAIDLEEIVAAAGTAPPDVEIGLDDPCELIYTSGTTGVPKGAIWTHGSVIWNSIQQILDYGITRHDSTYVTLGSFYIGGRHDFTMSLFHQGGTVHLRRIGNFDPDQVLRYLAEHRISVILLMPTLLYDVHQSPVRHQVDLRSLRMIMSGGAPVPIRTIEQTMELLPHTAFVQVYGATEVGGTVTQLTREDSVRKIGSCGKATVHNEVFVVDELGVRLGPDQVGEIVVRGPSVIAGYWGNPDATRAVLRDDGAHTGDLGRFDDEGYLYIVGRKKDMIISGGMNIYPDEIEQVIRRHPAIADVAVIGVPDERWGESVLAVVQTVAGEQVTADEIIALCRREMASYKKPRYVEFVDEMPRTISGKTQKHELRAVFHPRFGAAPSRPGA